MFELFKKKLTVKEIEDALHKAFLAFDNINEPKDLEMLILSFKKNYSTTCPKSLLLRPSVLHADEIYIFIWCFMFRHMADSGLRVNPKLFTPHSPAWTVLDSYIQDARRNFKMKIWLEGFWQIEEAGHIQEKLSSESREMIGQLIKKSNREQKALESNIDWHDAGEFSSFYSSECSNEMIRFPFPIDPENWDSEELWVVFRRNPANKTVISARPA